MIKACLLILLSLPLYSCASNNEKDYSISISDKSKEKINNIIKNTVIPNQNLSHGELIKHISSVFLGTPYVANTLIGGSEQNEVLVANLSEVDCFTFIDYVEALSQSTDEHTFISNLINTRYKDGSVTYYARKHFFTDWYSVLPKNTRNVTTTISSNYINVNKQLNQKTDGSEYIKGLGIMPRTITYIPGKEINQAILDNLQTGDYIGVYSPLNGLDVSHTGIVIKENNQVFYRNASSLAKNMKVVDTPFVDYISTKPGFIVLRSNK